MITSNHDNLLIDKTNVFICQGICCCSQVFLFSKAAIAKGVGIISEGSKTVEDIAAERGCPIEEVEAG
jgi:hypothetical protein